MLQRSQALPEFTDKGAVKFTAPATSSLCLGLLLHLHPPANNVTLLFPFSFIFLLRLNLEAQKLFNYLRFLTPPPPALTPPPL